MTPAVHAGRTRAIKKKIGVVAALIYWRIFIRIEIN